MLLAIRETGSIGRAAERLGLSYRYLWGCLKKQEAVFEEVLLHSAAGKSARLSEFGERLLWAEQRIVARQLPTAAALAASIDNELLLALHPELQRVTIVASYDPLFAALREGSRRQAGILLDLDYLNSVAVLERLNNGLCLIAGLHLPVAADYLCRRDSIIHSQFGSQLRLSDHKLIRFASRQQGLMLAPGNPLGISAIAELAQSGLRFVNRQPGSGTRVLFDALLHHHGLPPQQIPGYDSAESTHLAVAATIAAGYADCGFGLQSAAEKFKLDFLPLLGESYFLVCRGPQLESATVQALIALLRGREFRKAAAALPGYAADSAGEIISLRRMLPWYK